MFWSVDRDVRGCHVLSAEKVACRVFDHVESIKHAPLRALHHPLSTGRALRVTFITLNLWFSQFFLLEKPSWGLFGTPGKGT